MSSTPTPPPISPQSQLQPQPLPATSKVLDDLLAQLSLDFDLDNPLDSQSSTAVSTPLRQPSPPPPPRPSQPPTVSVSASHVTFSEFDWADLNAMANHIDELLDDSTPLGRSHSVSRPRPQMKRSAASKRLSRVILSSSPAPAYPAYPPSVTAAPMGNIDEGNDDDDDDDDKAPIAATLSRSASRSYSHHTRTATTTTGTLPLVAPAAETATSTQSQNQKRRRSRSRSKSKSRANRSAVPASSAASTLAQKLAKAKIQKLHTKVQIGSNPPTRVTQPISVASITPAADIVEYLTDTLDLSVIDPPLDSDSSPNLVGVVVEPLLATTNDTNDDDPPPEYTLFEYFSDLDLVRPIRPWEPLGDVLRSWEPAQSANSLAMRKDTYARLPEYALLGPPARMAGVLHWESRPGHYKKRHVELRLGAEARRHARSEFAAPGTLTGTIDVAQSTEVASVWMGRAKSSSPVDTLVCSLAHFDVYTFDPQATARKRAPSKYGFALKNAAARMAQFEEKSEYVHWFYAESQQQARAWVVALRACKAHVDRFAHSEWFDDDDDDHVQGAADDKQQQLKDQPEDQDERKSISHHSQKSSAGGPTQPMFHTLLNLDADNPSKPVRHDDGGPLLRDISAPSSSIQHGTTIVPIGANGKPLLDFSENLAGFTLERPTLLASTLSRSKTIGATSPSAHAPRQIPGTLGGGGSTLHRSASESHPHHSPTSSRSQSRARASPSGGSSPTLVPRHPHPHPRAHSPPPPVLRYPAGAGGVSDSGSNLGVRDDDKDDDDSDDEVPLGTLSRRPTLQSTGTSNSNSPYLMPMQLPVGGGASAPPTTTTLARNQSTSRSRPAASTTAAATARPAAGVHLGGALDESNVGGKGTLLDQIGRKRNEQASSGAQGGQQRRGLIDQIPSASRGGSNGGRW
ncbi:hypothetical protein BCR44DRAFT_1438682 [Catenaria anguillulae PL171]|uniref:PH domain-containing protein n=1 Tax=Catenaria anguillulae PL171 TaxID=765915 RepID=A0A1Y2HFC6_9FUNG|nr:hypothetical protein BCR44DRAFT_1438682 [Catenaria anguillulae PL171]